MSRTLRSKGSCGRKIDVPGAPLRAVSSLGRLLPSTTLLMPKFQASDETATVDPAIAVARHGVINPGSLHTVAILTDRACNLPAV